MTIIHFEMYYKMSKLKGGEREEREVIDKICSRINYKCKI